MLVLGDLLGNTIYKSKSTRSLLLGNPNIIIRDGVMDRKLLTKNKLDVNQVLSILRLNNVFSVL